MPNPAALLLPLFLLAQEPVDPGAAPSAPPPPRVAKVNLGERPLLLSPMAPSCMAGADIQWQPHLTVVESGETTAVLFVQRGESTGRVQAAATEDLPVEIGVGDLVLLRPGMTLELETEIGGLVFRMSQPLPDDLPPVIRPDHDPRITDTPGGCATEAGAYRRVCLTWEGKNGPYLFHALNAHRVRIRDSFTHYHPLEGGFDELYLVQDALPGAELIVCDRLDELLAPDGLDRESAATLLQRLPVRTGDLVFLPRGTAHRGVGGILAQVITLPGFVPGAEIGVDDAIRAVNDRFGLDLPHHDPAAPFVAVLERQDHVRVEVGDQLFTEYRFADGPRAFFHPVRAADGRPMTRGFPMAPRAGEERDHPHHQSLWFAHGDVDGFDFWHDPNVEMRLVGIEDAFSRGGVGGFTARHDWIGPDGQAILRDRRVFRFFAKPSSAGENAAGAAAERWIDWDLSLTAPDERAVRFGDTKEGTMALRVAAPLRAEGKVATGRLLNSAGQKGADAWGERAAWLLTTGELDGRAAGIAILEHPTNFRFPTWWHARTYGLLAANPFGVHDFASAPAGTGDFELGPGETLRLRYRFVFAAGPLTAGRVAAIAEAWQ